MCIVFTATPSITVNIVNKEYYSLPLLTKAATIMDNIRLGFENFNTQSAARNKLKPAKETCPHCLHSELTTYQLNHQEALRICTNVECSQYLTDEKSGLCKASLSSFIVQRDYTQALYDEPNESLDNDEHVKRLSQVLFKVLEPQPTLPQEATAAPPPVPHHDTFDSFSIGEQQPQSDFNVSDFGDFLLDLEQFEAPPPPPPQPEIVTYATLETAPLDIAFFYQPQTTTVENQQPQQVVILPPPSQVLSSISSSTNETLASQQLLPASTTTPLSSSKSSITITRKPPATVQSPPPPPAAASPLPTQQQPQKKPMLPVSSTKRTFDQNENDNTTSQTLPWLKQPNKRVKPSPLTSALPSVPKKTADTVVTPAALSKAPVKQPSPPQQQPQPPSSTATLVKNLEKNSVEIASLARANTAALWAQSRKVTNFKDEVLKIIKKSN